MNLSKSILALICLIMVCILLLNIINEFLYPIIFSIIAGMSTMLGGLIVLTNNFNKTYVAFMNGMATGVMIIISVFDMVFEAFEEIGFKKVMVCVMIGVGIFIFMEDLLTDDHKHDLPQGPHSANWLLPFLVVTAHNAPEGCAVVLASINSMKRGFLMMLAICLHNIPEGLVVATPIYMETKNKNKALYYTFLSAIAEPIGAILCLTVLKPYLSNEFLHCVLSVVAGIMLSVSLAELAPKGLEMNAQKFKRGLLVGGVGMGASIYMLH